MSTLGYAILGLLAAKPRTGYDLARLMRAPIGYMWTAQHRSTRNWRASRAKAS